MKEIVLENEIPVCCITASSFPAGVMAAHKQLHALLAATDDRTFYGISHMGKDGQIVYKAAMQETYAGEAAELNCESFVIKKGTYLAEDIANWCADPAAIGRTFNTMLAHPRIDKNGYCLEIYTSETDMQCLVKLYTD